MDQIPDARYAYALALGILELKLSKKHEKYRAIKTKVYDLDSFRRMSIQMCYCRVYVWCSTKSSTEESDKCTS